MRQYLFRWDFSLGILLGALIAWAILDPLVLHPGYLILHIELPPPFAPEFNA